MTIQDFYTLAKKILIGIVIIIIPLSIFLIGFWLIKTIL